MKLMEENLPRQQEKPGEESAPDRSRRADLAFLILFIIILAAVPLCTLLGPHSGVSYYEQRALAPVPEVTVQRLWSGEVFTDAETFYSDHIASRDRLLKAYTWLNLQLDRPKVNDLSVRTDKLLSAFGFGRWNLEYLEGQAEEAAVGYAGLNQLITGYGGYFCYLGLPLQSSYFADHYPDCLESRLWHTTAIREQFGAAMEQEAVPFLSMYEEYEAQGLPDVWYFATDHHYTLKGAFRAYEAVLEKIRTESGTELPDSPVWDWSTLPNPFLGSSNRKLYGLWANTDQIELAVPQQQIPFTRTDNGQTVESSVFSLPGTDTENATYSVYMGGDLAETIIDTGREKLPSLLIYGDSFTNPLETLLWTEFNVTYCVDFRYYKEQSLEDYIRQYQPDIVICVRDETTFLSADGNGQT